MFGPGVGIYTARHEVEIQGRLEKVEYTRPVRIGSDCWIGANAIILSGVTIGRGEFKPVVLSTPTDIYCRLHYRRFVRGDKGHS